MISRILINRAFSTTSTAAATQSDLLLVRLKQQLKQAMKDKDQLRLNVLRGLISDRLYVDKGTTSTPTGSEEEATLKVLKKALKRRKQAAEIYQKAGAADKAQSELQEAEFIQLLLTESSAVAAAVES